ncbi:MAG: DUF1643 domain-containing protein [Leptolyngbyaceae bacterium]|nr:DUF1643 domain-containing protein [Leptolyngbyaceae bacterium]
MFSRIESQPSGAIFSPCHRYRYVLWRSWNLSQPTILFIGLNPSTADVVTNDPTIRRCIGFAQAWGYGRLIITNLFAYRTPQPQVLRQVADPIGPDTDAWIKRLCRETIALTAKINSTCNGEDRIMAIWGNAGGWQGRDRAILTLIRPIVPQLYCLKVTQQGQPAHPLYQAKTLQPQRYQPQSLENF